jgi:small-conductance mechanosensitive channel
MLIFWQTKAFEPLLSFRERLQEFLPNLLLSLLVVVAGFALALLLREVISRGLRALKFDRLATRMGVSEAVERVGGFRSPSYVAGQLVFWIVAVFALLGGLYELDTAYTRGLVDRFFGYLPNLIVAAFILLIGTIVSRFLARGVLLAAVNAGMRGARLAAGLVRFLVLVLAAVAALEHLGIGRATVLLAFGIVFGGVVLALAIAFGLGGRDLARDVLEGQLRKPKEETDTEGIRHL